MNAELPPFKNGDHNSESVSTIDRVITPLKWGLVQRDGAQISGKSIVVMGCTSDHDLLRKFNHWLSMVRTGPNGHSMRDQNRLALIQTHTVRTQWLALSGDTHHRNA